MRILFEQGSYLDMTTISNTHPSYSMRNGYTESPEPGETEPLVSEEVVGNVSKLCVVPPGYRGPPRRGHLIFDANFESGKIVSSVAAFDPNPLYLLRHPSHFSIDSIH